MHPHRYGATAAIVLSMSIAAHAKAENAPETRRLFNIAAGPAASSITEFARQAGINVLASGENLAGIETIEVRGNYLVSEALDKLLFGTSLTSRVNSSGAVFIMSPGSKQHGYKLNDTTRELTMNNSTPLNQPTLRKTMIAAAAMTLAGNLHAQEVPEVQEQAPTVTITGLRASLESSLRKKRDDNSIVDVIKSEDMGKFPDTNLAESMQRVPGVVIDRDAGEGRTITVRGLGQDFTKIRINGIEAQATTGGADNSGGTNRGRGFDFNVFASELFNSITVRKSSSADVDEGSLGATVDLQTARPFDYKGFQAVLGVKGTFNDLSRTTAPRATFLLSNTSEDRKFGILLSGAYSKRNLIEEGFSSGGWQDGSFNGGWCAPMGLKANPASSTDTTCGPAAQGVPRLPGTPEYIAAYNAASNPNNFSARFPRFGRMTHNQDRYGFTTSLQWRPEHGSLLTFDMLYSKLDATRKENYLESLGLSRALSAGGRPQTSVLDTAYDSNGALLYGLYNAVDIRSEAQFAKLSTTFAQPILTYERDLGDSLRLTTRIGRATSKFRNPVNTTTTLDAPNVNGYYVDFRPDPHYALIKYPFDVTKLGGALTIVGVPDGATTYPNNLPSEIRMRPQGTTNISDVLHADLVWDAIPEQLSVKFGGDAKKYQFSTYEYRRNSELAYAPPAGTSVASISTLLTGYGRGQPLPEGSITSWVIPNYDALMNAYDANCNCLKTGPAGGPGDFTLSYLPASARGNNRAVKETDKSFFVMGEFNTELAGYKVRGNAGVRYAKTSMESSGYQSAGGGTLVTVENDYANWLPSMNLAANLTQDVLVRFAAARVMARPQLPALTPGGAVNTTGILSVTSGNPQLKPFLANTVDTNVEWYFDKNAFFGVGVFTKNIQTYIQSLQTDVPYSQTGLPKSLLPPNFTGEESFSVTRPINTPGGRLSGVEINYQQPFSFLPEWGRNFGMLLNYTKVKSKIQYVGTAPGQIITDDLINMSPTARNATLYYDDGKLNARLSASSRSAFLTRVPGSNAGNDVEGKMPSTNVDFSISYKLTDKLECSFEGTNLTNQANLQFASRLRKSVGANQVTGREFTVGARYKF